MNRVRDCTCFASRPPTPRLKLAETCVTRIYVGNTEPHQVERRTCHHRNNGLLPAEITSNLFVNVPLALPNLGFLTLAFMMLRSSELTELENLYTIERTSTHK